MPPTTPQDASTNHTDAQHCNAPNLKTAPADDIQKVEVENGDDSSSNNHHSRADPAAAAAAAARRVRAFQFQTHGLRINVSELAACAGFHPYKSLPKLLCDHVYQGIPGQALLRQDAKLLGLHLVSDEQVWRELAQTAGASTQRALQEALQVPTGQTKVASVQAAEELRRKVVQAAQTSKKLTSQQVATLEEGARHSIHTGFGTVWESHALDLYEQHCGWEVMERNAEVRVWDFDATGQTLGPPRSAYRERRPARESSETELLGDDGKKSLTEKEESLAEKASSRGIKRQRVDNGDEAMVVWDLTAIEDGGQLAREPSKDSMDTGKRQSRLTCNKESPHELLPYFSLRGSVDGIRQEMAPVAQQKDRIKKTAGNSSNNDDGDLGFDDDDDDTTWEFRQVIVECKHRMSRLQPSPPIYEMIQATVYCLMYGTEEADLVQVLRNRLPRRQKNTTGSETTKGNQQNEGKENESSANKITEYYSTNQNGDADTAASGVPTATAEKVSQPVVAEESRDETDLAVRIESKLESYDDKIVKDRPIIMRQDQDEAAPNMEIAVTRISIDDQVFQHRQNWSNIVNPRLQSWAQAVYAVRKDDDRRYRLLAALSAENLHDAWDVLLKECPWLHGCDTSYHRDLSSTK